MILQQERPGILIRLPAAAPWRIGPSNGQPDAVDTVLHSDTLYSAVTHAMARLGWMEDWLAATVTAGEEPAVLLTSLYPFSGTVLFAPPPAHLWPPSVSAKVRWKSATLVPLTLIPSLVAEEAPAEDQWWVDPDTRCLLPLERGSNRAAVAPPFRLGSRVTVPLDRLTGTAGPPSRYGCLEFADGAGMWCAVAFAGAEAHQAWRFRMEAAFRLLADTGLGGQRSRGMGRAADAWVEEGTLPALLVPPMALRQDETVTAPPDVAYWLLSLFVPSESDQVDWKRGRYRLVERRGRVDGPAAPGAPKKVLRMVSEGSVLHAGRNLLGRATNVAPEGGSHPVYSSGFAFALPVPVRGGAL